MIFFNGCSFTAGSECPDPETNRFSRLVSQHYNTEEVNISESGRCNDAILRTTIEWFQKNGNCDYAVIQWSEWDRVEWAGKDGHRWNIGNGTCNKEHNEKYKSEHLTSPSESYYKYYHSNYLSTDNFYKNWYLLKLFFESINQKYCYIQLGGPRGPRLGKNIQSTWDWIDFVNPPEVMLWMPFKERKWYSGTHPSPLGHQFIKEKLVNDIIQW